MKEATYYDLLQRDAQGTYESWTDSLRLLRQVTNASARMMYESELADLYAKAQKLLDTEQLNGKVSPMMKVILSRPLEQWLILNRHPKSPLIPTY